MIIRRQLYPENKLPIQKVHDNGMEVKPIYSKVPQKNFTSGDTSIRRDVDNLLKPIKRPTYNDESDDQQNQFSKERTERNLWRNEEVMEMLYTMQQVKALEKLNDKTVKSEHVFKDVEVIMHRNGFVKKSHVQIWTKWKFLKSTYMTSKRNGVIPRIVPPQIYDMIHQMLTGLKQSLADSCSSVDGDNSSGMVISGVETSVANENDEDSFGMAHPIFGFRLGMVKSEPEDTGYEPIGNNDSDEDPLVEQSSACKLDIAVEENKNEAKSNKEPALPAQKVLETPHRGRGRPPKKPLAGTSTPSNTPSTAAMPPLRVAPFAKAVHTPESLAVSRSPPPLTMPPTSRIRVANLSNLKSGDASKFAQPKLIPKPTYQQHSPPLQPGRVSKESTAQARPSSIPSSSYPKMKQIPMRKTPYSLRPDRAIPDLEASLSPPPRHIDKPSNKKLEEVTSIKNLIMQSNTNNFPNMANRKRRTDWQYPVPSKEAKYDHSIDEEKNNSKTCNTDYDKNYGKVLQNVIIDLSSSLRKMQTEMMRDFFNKQNELLEREHKFQMQQDRMIMKAFQEQTQEIMHSVEHLVGSIKTYKNDSQNHTKENIKEAKPIAMRMRQTHAQEREEKMEVGQMENNSGNDEENEIEDEEGQQGEQETGDVYTDDEQQQIEDHDDNEQDEMEDNVNEEENEHNEEHEDQDQSQSIIEQHENDQEAEVHDNSNSSLDDNQNPIRMVSSKLNKD